MNYYPFLVNPPQYPFQNSYFNFNLPQKYDKFNETLAQKNHQIEFLKSQNEKLKQNVLDLSEKLEEINKKPKPIRKITKNYYQKNSSAGPDSNSRLYCPYEDCRHHYSSILALNFHIRFKHYGGNKKERQAYAVRFFNNQENNHRSRTEGIRTTKNQVQLSPVLFLSKKYRESYLKSRKLNNLEFGAIENLKKQSDSSLKSE